MKSVSVILGLVCERKFLLQTLKHKGFNHLPFIGLISLTYLMQLNFDMRNAFCNCK